MSQKNFGFTIYQNCYKSAEAGEIDAMTSIGAMYFRGEGVVKDETVAFNWSMKAAENGIDDALEELGAVYYDAENYSQAMYWYKKAAENGNADCMNYIGVMYASGKGVSESQNEAVKWYRRAMDAGSVWAIHNLGYCCYHGKGVPENNATAFEYFSKAAQKGISDSMIYLGHMYRKGYYVNTNSSEALSWYKKALDAGNNDAQQYIDEIYSERNHSSSSGGCFITTAVCDSLNKPDNCTELTTFTKFRDEWLINQPDGKDLITEYYSIAPKIVSKINESPDSKDIYNSIWREFLSPCLNFIQYRDNVSCKKKYIEMVHYLQKNYS